MPDDTPVFLRLRRRAAGALSPPPELKLPGPGQAAGPAGTPPDNLRRRLPLIVLLAALAAIAIARYLAVRQHIDMGPDIANYLSTMNTFFGNDVAGTGLLRPPLIALPLKALALVFGDLTGARLLGVLVSVAIGLPFYLIVRRMSHPWMAVAATVLFVLTPAYAKMLSWGYITMFGLFFTMLAAYFFVSILDSPARHNVILAGLCASLVLGFHQLTAAFFVPLLAVLVLGLVLLDRDRLRRSVRPFTAALVLAVLLSLPYLPVYLHLLDMQSSQGGEAGMSAAPFLLFASGIGLTGSVWLMVPALALAAGSLVWLQRYDRGMAILLGALLAFSLALTVFTLPPPFVELNRRAQYFLYVPLWASAAFALSLLWSWRPAALRGLRRRIPALAAAVIVLSLITSMAVASQMELRQGLDYYSYLDGDRLAAVQWIKQSTPGEATVAAYPENLGWWIQGIGHRATYEVTERNMEANTMEKQRSLVAELVLSRNRGLSNGRVRLATSYPYTDLPGNPVIGSYVGGRYQDLLMFDDHRSTVQVEGSGALRLDQLPRPEFSLDGDGSRMQMVTTYRLDDAAIVTTATLDEGSGSAVITCFIHSGHQAVTGLEIPLLLCYEPVRTPAFLPDGRIEVVQELKTPFDGVVPVTTTLLVQCQGAILRAPGRPSDDGVPLTFDVVSATATITLSFDFSATTPPPASEQVSAFEVPRLLREHGIDYLAVDFRPGSPMWSDMPPGLQEWLDACPYYRFVHAEGDVRIYEVLAVAAAV